MLPLYPRLPKILLSSPLQSIIHLPSPISQNRIPHIPDCSRVAVIYPAAIEQIVRRADAFVVLPGRSDDLLGCALEGVALALLCRCCWVHG